ncbi:MAG TPA: PepSY domain-containing protein, partial [Rhodanobacter sp.]|nr:PepSY domain-containing protein [Rhodanobacter sp.]
MKANRILPLLAPLALLLALGANPAAAQARPKDLSLGEAVSRAQQETNGQVLSADSVRRDRRTEYRIKVLTPQGHVRVMTIPANGGDSA